MLQKFIKGSKFFTTDSDGGAFEEFVTVDKKSHFFGFFLRRSVDQRWTLAGSITAVASGDGRVGAIQLMTVAV